MEPICKKCGKDLSDKRTGAKFCSEACRVNSHKKEIRAKSVGASATGKRDWVPSRRESVVNNIVWKFMVALDKIRFLLSQMEKSAAVEELLNQVVEAGHLCNDDAVWDIEGFDIGQRIDDPEAFEKRTGLSLGNGKRPIE
jgi:hypothetical protein